MSPQWLFVLLCTGQLILSLTIILLLVQFVQLRNFMGWHARQMAAMQLENTRLYAFIHGKPLPESVEDELKEILTSTPPNTRKH
jgi:hypothetical protein